MYAINSNSRMGATPLINISYSNMVNKDLFAYVLSFHHESIYLCVVVILSHAWAPRHVLTCPILNWLTKTYYLMYCLFIASPYLSIYTINSKSRMGATY